MERTDSTDLLNRLDSTIKKLSKATGLKEKLLKQDKKSQKIEPQKIKNK